MELTEAAAQNQRWVHTGWTNRYALLMGEESTTALLSVPDTQTSLQHKLQKERLKARMGRRDTASLLLPTGHNALYTRADGVNF